jgi:hypothetical protein
MTIKVSCLSNTDRIWGLTLQNNDGSRMMSDLVNWLKGQKVVMYHTEHVNQIEVWIVETNRNLYHEIKIT